MHPFLTPLAFRDGRILPCRILPGPMEGVSEAVVSHTAGTAVVTLSAPIENDVLKKAIEDLGAHYGVAAELWN